MQELTRSQLARLAIREFKILTDAMAVRGGYRMSGNFGEALESSLKELSPEIYGTMNDPRVVEIKGLEYVFDRLPKGIESATKVIMTDEEQFDENPFETVTSLKRRRTTYRISPREFCFIISRGTSEIYDIITHMTFLNNEAKKLHRRLMDEYGNPRSEWIELEKACEGLEELDAGQLDSAIWNLSIILGRPYIETRQFYEYFEKNKQEHNSNSGLFFIIYHLVKRIEKEHRSRDDALTIYLTPSLMKIIGHQKYGRIWATQIKDTLRELDLHGRPLHVISSNLHSVTNLIYGYAAMGGISGRAKDMDLYEYISQIKDDPDRVTRFAAQHGWTFIKDTSGTNIHCQVIDTRQIQSLDFHPGLEIDPQRIETEAPVLLVMDYAFGVQAFELMEQLLKPMTGPEGDHPMIIGSISIMGKAGILPGTKGEIMLATAHVCEGSSDNYIVDNDLMPEDFDGDIRVFTGPMATVLGTSLQNRDILEMFQSEWHAVGLEMEGGYYQKAINAAIIKQNIPRNIRTRYAYYASDNPLETGNTLAAGAMGTEGIKPTYMITKVILRKILGKP